MKKVFLLILWMLPVLIGSHVVNSWCQEPEKATVILNLPSDFFSQVCPQPINSGTTLYWEGLQDERFQKSLGQVAKKGGKDPIQIFSDPPIEQLLESHLKSVMLRCGFQWAKSPEMAKYRFKVVLKQFDVQEEKKLLTGKAMASSRLEFVAKSLQKSTTGLVGYNVEDKKIRQRRIKHAKKILGELMQGTLQQVAASEFLQGL